MALWELDEFQGARFLGFIRSVPTPEPFAAQAWLPNRTVFDLEFEYIKGVLRRPVMAHVMGWDSEAPIHGRPGLGERVTGELPPIKRKAKFGEKELIRFLQPRAGSPDVQTAINSVYQLTGDLLDSIQARVEWLRMQALSEDSVVYNEGGVIFNFDYGLNDTYQLDLVTQLDGAGTSIASAVGDPWSTIATANPVADLQYICNKVEDETGVRPARMVCSRKTLGYLLNNTVIRQLIRGSAAPTAILTRQELDTVFNLYDLPTIRIYDVKVDSEAADGTYSQVRTMAENKAFLLPSFDIGETLWGPTAESRPLLGTPLASQAPGIIAKTYGKEEPPSEWVKAAAVAFPSLPDAQFLAQLTLYA